MPVRNEGTLSEEKVMDTTRCDLGKLLVVPTFVARRLQVRKNAGDPSGES